MRSPRGPPNGPALPSPVTRIWAPESTPAGTLTPTGSTTRRTPRPRHAAHRPPARGAGPPGWGAGGPASCPGREPLNVQPHLRPANPLGEGQLGDRVSVVAAPSLAEGLVG